MIKQSKGNRVFQVINWIIMFIVIICTLVPYLNILAKSFSSTAAIYNYQVSIWPVGVNVETYAQIVKQSIFWIDYRNTVLYTVAGTLISLILTSILAYALSVERLKFRNFFTMLVVITMFFSGGIIPNFILVKSLGMYNTVWAVLLPGAVSAFYVIVMRTFFQGIPNELEEAAQVDGMSTYGLFIKIIIPLSKPIIATMVLFMAVGGWNAWFGPFLYLSNSNMQPVAVFLRNVIAGSTVANSDPTSANLISANVKSVCIVLTSIPIICVYPFLQRYFVNGVMIGSLKG